MSFESRYKQLNKAQKEAVDTIDGPVMVVAGPGTGKTELLSMRVANILQKTDTLPENILCLTFTESGQAAMRERLVDIIGKDAYKVAIHTFHSFGSDIISKNREYFYKNALFQPADDLRRCEVLRSIFDNLNPNNPLASMVNGEYTHLRDTKDIISELKRRSALTSDELLALLDQNEATLDALEHQIVDVFGARVSKSIMGKLSVLSDRIKTHASEVPSLYQITPLAHVLSESFDAMLVEATNSDSTKPITAWKADWLELDYNKNLVFKDRKRLIKLRELSHIYYEYLNQMEKLGLFDFDDMIMQVVHAINVYNDLRFNLQEKYLYIMVDEFQDTNPAQMRILSSLTDNPVSEGAPNILVVGDDDQAIYSFQGADISNIMAFSSLYPTRKLVVLTENYRSGPEILAASRHVISQASDRLESQITELDKALSAQPGAKSVAELWQAPNITAERLIIRDGILNDIKSGTPPHKIAVLARRHKHIKALLPYLSDAGIAVRYEHEDSVLDSPPIESLILVARLIVALSEGRHDLAQELLPKVLAHPAWRSQGITPEILWKLSLDAYTKNQNWLEAMLAYPELQPIQTLLVELAGEVSITPLEPLIDKIIGVDQTSPYFDYYFSPEVLNDKPSQYLEYLSALQAMRRKLREYSLGQNLNLKSFIDFIDLHQKLGISIRSTQQLGSSEGEAVELLTAHKAKGMEFDIVYVLESVDTVWGGGDGSKNRSIIYPKNLPLSLNSNTPDERIRLFYVAMTRARKKLVLSYSDENDSGKNTPLADFLLGINAPTKEIGSSDMESEVLAMKLDWYQPLIEVSSDLKKILAPKLEKFKLSATSFNAFLDVTRGGPRMFLLNNLLHFPSAKSPSASFGTAVHNTLQTAHTHLLATGEQKPLEDVLHDFEVFLKKERLSDRDFTFYLEKGTRELGGFLSSGIVPMTTSQKAEVNFNNQDVHVGVARVTGSLDLVNINTNEKTIDVTDYKTGKPAINWDLGDSYTKQKLHKYRHQLLFYKLLVENSSDFSSYKVKTGQLAFIEPLKNGQNSALSLDLTNLPESELEHTSKLVGIVWEHILNLDLPDTSSYTQDLKGMQDFERDLLDGTI